MCDFMTKTETIFLFTTETESLRLELKLKVQLNLKINHPCSFHPAYSSMTIFFFPLAGGLGWKCTGSPHNLDAPYIHCPLPPSTTIASVSQPKLKVYG
jgi:hypothetical protein